MTCYCVQESTTIALDSLARIRRSEPKIQLRSAICLRESAPARAKSVDEVGKSGQVRRTNQFKLTCISGDLWISSGACDHTHTFILIGCIRIDSTPVLH